MKNRIFLIQVVGAGLLGNLWAASTYDARDERLSRNLQASLAACKYVDRSDDPFTDNYNEDSINPEEVLKRDWLTLPSTDFKHMIDKARTNPGIFEYKSAYCEVALHGVILDMGGGSSFIGPRCEALASEHEFFRDEYSGKKNNYLEGRTYSNSVTSAERALCNGRTRSELVLIACEAKKVGRDAYNQNTTGYRNALATLKKRCEPYIGRGGSRGLASTDDVVDRGPFLDRGGGGHTANRGVAPGSVLSGGPIVVPRYVPVPSGQWGACQQGRGLNVINYQPSVTHTIASGLIAGLGAYLNYDGQKRADEYKYKLLKHNMDVNAKLGAATMLGIGGPWSHGAQFPMQGGVAGWPGNMGGVCGRPPFNTAHTGCMGGMPGQPIMGGQCPGPQCGMIGGGCSPGMPCFGGGGGGPAMCPPGVPNCGAGIPGQCPGPMCGAGGGAGCANGMCNPNYPGNYMMNPAMQGRPGGMYGYNPYSLEQEQARLRQMQEDMKRRIEDMNRAQQYNNQLRDIQNQMSQLNNRYNTAMNGYNGIMSNQFGPAPNYGHPGAYQGPGVPNQPGCIGGGGGAGGMNCACTSIICYPGQSSAYYAPPFVYGNSGVGGPQFGYPRTNNGFFQIGVGWSARPVKTGVMNAR